MPANHSNTNCVVTILIHSYKTFLFRHSVAMLRTWRRRWFHGINIMILIAVHLICFSFRCNSYGPWTPTKCDSILIFTSFNNEVCCDIAYFYTKMSYLSDFKRTKSKTLRTAKQTEDELNKAAVWSSANNTNKRLTFLKFDYRKYSNFLLLYKSTCHLRLKWTQGKTF